MVRWYHGKNQPLALLKYKIRSSTHNSTQKELKKTLNTSSQNGLWEEWMNLSSPIHSNSQYILHSQ